MDKGPPDEVTRRVSPQRPPAIASRGWFRTLVRAIGALGFAFRLPAVDLRAELVAQIPSGFGGEQERDAGSDQEPDAECP